MSPWGGGAASTSRGLRPWTKRDAWCALASRELDRGASGEGWLAKSATELQFSSEQRAWLGLGESESVRVLASGVHTIVLERCGGDSAAALPWDRELVLVGDVRAFALADLLQILHASAKSGFLFFETGEHAKAVYLNHGEVVFATSNQMVDRLGQCLLRAGTITAEQFRDARDAFKPGTRFGRILVERGYLTPRQLWNGVRLQVGEIVRSLFSYGAGTVLFWEGEVRPDNAVRLALPTRRLVAEGLQQRDELLKFLAWLEDPRTRLEQLSGLKLSGTEQAIYEAIQGELRFREVCRKAGIDALSGARTIRLLRLLGAVKVTRPEEGGDALHLSAGGGNDDESVRECVQNHVKIMAELVAPIVAMDGGEGLRERLAGIVEEAAERFPAILSGVQVGPGGMVDPEEITQRALRFPGERECESRLALGELISYLEFELLNHPKITEPEQFLEGLEEMRSRL